MRDYLYIWHDSENKFIVASGLEFKDFERELNLAGGVFLIDHQSDTATHDPASGFHFASRFSLSELAAEDIYSWGNFVWADYLGTSVPTLPKEEISELLYFAHRAEPLNGNTLPHLGNNFLGYAHDDGWYLKLYYAEWSKIAQFLTDVIPRSLGQLDTSDLQQGKSAYWLRKGKIDEEERTHDVDSVLNRRL